MAVNVCGSFLDIVYLYIASYLHDFYPQDLEASLSAHVAIGYSGVIFAEYYTQILMDMCKHTA